MYHICDSHCQVYIDSSSFRCWLNYLLIFLDNTKYINILLANDFSKDYLIRLIKIGIVEEMEVTRNRLELIYKCKLVFFYLKRYMLPANSNYGIIMSLYKEDVFTICYSMQSIQLLTQTGRVNKYIWKYIENRLI